MKFIVLEPMFYYDIFLWLFPQCLSILGPVVSFEALSLSILPIKVLNDAPNFALRPGLQSH